MRTREEIIKELRLPPAGDLFGFRAGVVIAYLDFEKAKEFLNPEVKAEDWKQLPLIEEVAIVEMREYMDFAWGKVRDHRGISASISVEKMEAWLWLLGDDETLRKVQQARYENYGAPKLAVVCDRYGFPIPEEDWARNMIASEKCCPDCEEGCGR